MQLSNIPEGPAYGVYASRLVAIARACDSFDDFKLRHSDLCKKLMCQGYRYTKLCKCMAKITQRHRDLFSKYGSVIEVPLDAEAKDASNVTVRS